MRIISLAAIAFSAIVASHGARADGACMTAADLVWSPSIARAVPTIDVGGKGCVTADQIQRYRAAVKQARMEEKARVVTLLGGSTR